MQVNELYRLSEWFEEHVTDAVVMSCYKEFAMLVNQNAQQRGSVSYAEAQEKLYEELTAIPLPMLTIEQNQALRQLNVYELLGQSGVDTIEKLTTSRAHDIASIAEKVTEDYERIIAAGDRLKALGENLLEAFDVEELSQPFKGEMLVRVYFRDEASITDLKKLQDFSDDWYHIGNGIALAKDKDISEFKVLGAHKGSIIIDLSTGIEIAILLADIVMIVMEASERIGKFRKHKRDAQALNNEAINVVFEDEIQKMVANEREQMLATLNSRFNFTTENRGDKTAALERSAELLAAFIDRGGAVDIVETTEIEEESTSYNRKGMTELTTKMREIRKLEASLKLLPSGDLQD